MRKTISKRECSLNIGRMLKNLPTKFKYNVAIYKLNVYKTSIEKPPLAPRKILILRIKHCQYWKYVPLILLYYKQLKTLELLRLNFSKFLGDQYAIMITVEYFIETRRCLLNITFLQNFLWRSMLASIKRVWSGQNANDLYVENNTFQKIREYNLNIAHMPIILHTKIKCNIIPYNLNSYNTFTKWPQYQVLLKLKMVTLIFFIIKDVTK